ncbi:hypothetical protein ACOCJ7_02720 [Knoellia sp. CPCC 206453]|uniref:hypothetical protein n=1 Tax=Knoellia pratensis TaxID=3404796 RepID=UPI003615628F
MPLQFTDIDFKVDLPDIPRTTPVVTHTPPCLRDSAETTRAIAEVLDIDVKGHRPGPPRVCRGQRPRPSRGLLGERRGPCPERRATHGIRR